MDRRYFGRRTGQLSVLCTAVALWALATAANAQVLVVLSDDAASYQQMAEELRAGLKAVRDGRLRIDTVAADRVGGIEVPAFRAYELVVTVGVSAAQATLNRERARQT